MEKEAIFLKVACPSVFNTSRVFQVDNLASEARGFLQWQPQEHDHFLCEYPQRITLNQEDRLEAFVSYKLLIDQVVSW